MGITHSNISKSPQSQQPVIESRHTDNSSLIVDGSIDNYATQRDKLDCNCYCFLCTVGPYMVLRMVKHADVDVNGMLCIISQLLIFTTTAEKN